eukprot:4549516-Amphidinium_carterae.1
MRQPGQRCGCSHAFGCGGRPREVLAVNQLPYLLAELRCSPANKSTYGLSILQLPMTFGQVIFAPQLYNPRDTTPSSSVEL